MSQGDGLNFVSAGPTGFFMDATRLDVAVPLKLQSYGETWIDLSADFVGDPLILTNQAILTRWGEYDKLALSWSSYQAKLYDGSVFTDITPTITWPILELIWDVDDGPNCWLLCGGNPNVPWNTRIKRMDHDHATVTDLSAASGFVRPIDTCKYSEGLGYFLLTDWTGSMRSYNGTVWVIEGNLGAFCQAWDSDTDGHDYMLVGYDSALLIPKVWTWDGTTLVDISVAAGFNPGWAILSVKYHDGLWLVGAEDGLLKSYDGTNWVVLKAYPDSVLGISYGEGFWKVGGGDWSDLFDTPFLERYDGVTFTDLLPSSGFTANIHDVEFCGTP